MAERLVGQPQEVDRLRAAAAFGISYGKFHGRESRQFHRAYDVNGEQVPLNSAEAWELVVETEPEWDDDQRSQALALRAYERGICACGFHTSLTNDRSNYFTFEDAICEVCAGADRHSRTQQDRDEKVRKRFGDDVKPETRLPSDGRRTFIRQLSQSEIDKHKTGG